jgi:hypothetical protein
MRRVLTCIAIAVLAWAPHVHGQANKTRGRGTAAVINVPAAAGGGPNILGNPGINTIAADVHTATIAGGGRTGFTTGVTGIGNLIIGGRPASNASYSFIGGGYDNRNDMQAGTICGGAHHFLDSTNGSDHGFIGGGSLHVIDATGPYNAIAGGTGNHIGGAAQRAFIGGGQTNTITIQGAVIAGGNNNTAGGDSSAIGGGSSNLSDVNATAATISGGTQNQITGAGAIYGTISGGTQNAVTGVSYGSVGGGVSNSVTGQFGVVSGGTTNTASGAQSVVGGGSTNIASGTRTAVLSGANNTASGGDSATVINGQQNSATGAYCTVSGLRGTCTQYGQHTIANGFFAVAGDAQAWDLVMRATTTDATSTSLTLDGSTQLGLPQDNSTYVFRALVVGRRTDAGDNAGFEVRGVIKRDVGAATTAIVGTVTTTALGASDATWGSTAIADTTNGRLTIRVNGAVGKSVRWLAHVRVAAVAQ